MTKFQCKKLDPLVTGNIGSFCVDCLQDTDFLDAQGNQKEEDVFYYQGDYSSKELEELATQEVRDNTEMEYEDIEDCYVHIDFIFKSETPIKWIYD